ncbi:pyridoxamine 5'-phosphate oxidase family protein [Streptomyces sp. NEAU-YJ-81]|uniref:pyridoxamine 5'-phosphate oxidase family protein n=1 Tax=Streptomyces sp. NEAU-YJ-81 TaxID=2820288 RepID=UPI001FBA1B2E|nr:pyridoxamine 5'-phosphate oxidase family protein [Streptomyces sp. NEAU-YJ-81]
MLAARDRFGPGAELVDTPQGRGTIRLFTGPGSLKVRHLRSDPRAPIVVTAPVGERERRLSVAGHTTVEPDGAHDLAARYWDLDDPARADDRAGNLPADWVRIVIHPETVSRNMY